MTEKTKPPSKLIGTTTVKWAKKGFEEFCRNMELDPAWEAGLPVLGKTALTNPTRNITLYGAHFLLSGFRLPITRFQIDTLVEYGIHITQLSGIGMLRLVHFEACCRAMDIEPTFEWFNVFYVLVQSESWFNFALWSKVKSMGTDAPKSLYDWKEKFFYTKSEVILVAMSWKVLRERQKVPDHPVTEGHQEEELFNELTSNASQFDVHNCPKALLVHLGMSRLRLVAGQELVLRPKGMLLSLPWSEFDYYHISAKSFDVSVGATKLDTFMLRDKARVMWRAPPADRPSRVDKMVGMFYFPNLEDAPPHFSYTGENPINPDLVSTFLRREGSRVW